VIKLRQGKPDDARRDFSKASVLDPSLKLKLDSLLGESKIPASKP